MNAIEISSLSKRFKKSLAVDNISLSVEEGEIFGFLGPNGAGKSTTMMILTTLLKPTSGHASVYGYDVISNPSQVRKNIGFVQQEIGIDEYLTARENLQFQCKISQVPKEQVTKRIDEVIDLVELKEKQDEPSITFSGGMRKRLDIACGLIHRPKVLFLDEPTVGLDIQTRRKIWEYIRKIHKEFGMTLFVSTHYMEEADSLCDRVGIIDYGKIQAVDTPESMKNKLETDMITLSVTPDKIKKQQFIEKLKTLDLIKDVKINETNMIVQSSNSTQVIPKIFQISSEIGVNIDSFVLNKPTLDDVFISYTGHNLRDETNGKFNKRKEFNQSRRRGSMIHSDTYAIFWREMKRYRKSKSGVIIRLIQPAIWIVVMGNIFAGTQPLIQSVGFDGEYIEFMAPGVLILTAIFTSIFGGVNTLWDRRYGFMNKALTSPISRSSIALGKMLAISMIAAFQSSLILGMALALGVSMPQLWMIAPIMGIVILFSIGFSGISVMVAAAAKSQETFWGIINFLGMPLFLLSPALFPLELMPDWLASVAAFNPVSYTVILVREMMSGYVDSLSAMTSIAVLGIFSVVMIGLASYVFTRDVNKPF